jgi:S-adenosylmethionine synthetase
VREVIPEHLLSSDIEFIFNPSGRFEIGGPVADTGLTGRKIIVDTYGGYARHGGGAFSGKDATKVDRSGAYAARWAAKNLVAAGLASRLEIQLAYAIGKPEPFSIHVETFGTEAVDPTSIEEVVLEVFDFRPAAIIDQLGLTQPVFAPTAAYGHFGRPEFRWERLDRVDEIKNAAGV